MADQQKKLAFSILEYLQEVRSTATEDVSESLEVAIQCISDSFSVSLSNNEHKSQFSIAPLSLPTVFGLGLARKEQIESAIASATPQQPSTPVSQQDKELEKKFADYLKLLTTKGYFANTTEGTPEYQSRLEKAKAKFMEKYQNPQSPPPPSSSSSPAPAPAAPTPSSPSVQDPAERVRKAEEYKTIGNSKLSSNQHQEAIDNYSKAIELDPSNAIYYANRAAGYSHLNKHQLAIDDCNQAISRNPNYGKAYSRLGLANFALGRYSEAVANYKRALELDPSNATIKQSLESAEKKVRDAANPAGAGGTPGFPAGLAGGAPGAGGAMPDVNQLLNNPALMNMAQNVMAQPGFSEMLNNPAMMNMAQSFMQNPEALSGILQGVFGNQNNGGTQQ